MSVCEEIDWIGDGRTVVYSDGAVNKALLRVFDEDRIKNTKGHCLLAGEFGPKYLGTLW